jgi:hypothetical protein
LQSSEVKLGEKSSYLRSKYLTGNVRMMVHSRPNLWMSYIFWIFNRYNTYVIKINNEIIQKMLAVYVKNISNLLIGCICCVSEFSWCDCFTFSSYLNGRQYWHWTTWP